VSKKSGLKVEDLTKTNPALADWMLYGMRSQNIRKFIVVMDEKKKKVQILSWHEPKPMEFVDPFVRAVDTAAVATEDDGDNSGE
jgi:hypothetical protein